MIAKTIMTFAFTIAAIGCGIDLLENDKVETGEPDELDMISIPLEVVDKSALSLTSASAFSMDLTGCASGYSFTATEANATVNVYKYDEGCLMKLTSLTVGPTEYTSSNTNAVDFTTWLAGDAAVFTDASGFYSIAVGVVSQLSDPISGTEAISYSFAMVSSGADETIADTDVGDGHAISVDGHPAPSVTIASVAFSDINSTGAGEFTFSLECETAISTNDCDGVDMTGWEFVLVEDTYSSSPSPSELIGLTYSGVGSAVDSSIGAFGGIISPAMYGPNEIHNNPNMILVIKNDISYKYFNVDVTAISN
jgi:hypothetical protein